MWCSCVSGFELDLVSVAISSMHKGFEKHACGFGKKEKKIFSNACFKDLLLVGQ